MDKTIFHHWKGMNSYMKEFLKTKGYYLAIAIFVIAICVMGIAVIYNNTSDKPVINEPVTSGSEVINPVSSATPENTASATATIEPTPSDTGSSKPVDPETTPSQEPQLDKIVLTVPVEGEILNDYAAAKLIYNPTLKEWRTHPAIDYAATQESDIKAAFNGTVTAVKNDPRYGLTVILDHEQNLQTVYCGFSTVSVTKGDEVKTGDVLGKAGGEIFYEKDLALHLHFEVLLEGKNVNPKDYFASDK